jgi:hypothetical protein
MLTKDGDGVDGEIEGGKGVEREREGEVERRGEFQGEMRALLALTLVAMMETTRRRQAATVSHFTEVADDGIVMVLGKAQWWYGWCCVGGGLAMRLCCRKDARISAIIGW